MVGLTPGLLSLWTHFFFHLCAFSYSTSISISLSFTPQSLTLFSLIFVSSADAFFPLIFLAKSFFCLNVQKQKDDCDLERQFQSVVKQTRWNDLPLSWQRCVRVILGWISPTSYEQLSRTKVKRAVILYFHIRFLLFSEQ